MEADVLIQSIENLLKPLVEAEGGDLDVADNPWDVAGLLKISPAKWRVILSWDDEDAIEDQCRGGWVTGTLSVFVQAHRGFEAKPGLTIHRETPAGRVSVTRRISQVRKWLRAIQFEANDVAKDDFSHLIFLEASWIDGEDKDRPWRCRRLDFRIVYALDEPELVGGTVSPIISDVSEDGSFYIVTLDGVAVARVPRFDSEAGDTPSDLTGYALSSLSEDGGFYIVTLDGTPNGRIAAFAV